MASLERELPTRGPLVQARRASPSIAKIRAAARGITGDTSVASLRTSSSSPYRNASSSDLRSGAFATTQGAKVTIDWFARVTWLTSARAPEKSSASYAVQHRPQGVATSGSSVAPGSRRGGTLPSQYFCTIVSARDTRLPRSFARSAL